MLHQVSFVAGWRMAFPWHEPWNFPETLSDLVGATAHYRTVDHPRRAPFAAPLLAYYTGPRRHREVLLGLLHAPRPGIHMLPPAIVADPEHEEGPPPPGSVWAYFETTLTLAYSPDEHPDGFVWPRPGDLQLWLELVLPPGIWSGLLVPPTGAPRSTALAMGRAPEASSVAPPADQQPPGLGAAGPRLFPHQIHALRWAQDRERDLDMFVRDGLALRCRNAHGELLYVWPYIGLVTYRPPPRSAFGWFAFPAGCGKTAVALALVRCDISSLPGSSSSSSAPAPLSLPGSSSSSSAPPPPPFPSPSWAEEFLPFPPGRPSRKRPAPTIVRRLRQPGVTEEDRARLRLPPEDPEDDRARARAAVVSRATLAVVPTGVYHQWLAEAGERGLRAVGLCRLRPGQRHLLDSPDAYAGDDVDLAVITFDALLAQGRREEGTALMWVQWRRLIVDEAHPRLAQLGSSLLLETERLLSARRWILAASPMEAGRPADLLGQLAFLMGGRARWPAPSRLDAGLMPPILGSHSVEELLPPLAFHLTAFSTVGCANFNPAPTIGVHRVDLSPAEQQAYAELHDVAAQAAAVVRPHGGGPRSGMHLCLLRLFNLLRCASSAGPIAVSSARALLESLRAQDKDKVKDREGAGDHRVYGDPRVDSCPICLDEFDPDAAAMVTACGHLFHRDCLHPVPKDCPLCRRRLAGGARALRAWEPVPSPVPPPPEAEPEPEVAHTSKAREVASIVLHDCKDAGAGKSLVYSQYEGTLDAVGESLAALGIGCVRLGGSLDAVERGRRVRSFLEDPSIR